MSIKPYLLFAFIIIALPCVSVAKSSTERCVALNKSSTERCVALNKASTERCVALNKASTERCVALNKASSKQSTTSQKANAEVCAASQKANAEACVASQKANADACAASSSTLSINISWWPDAPLNFLKGIIDYYIGGFFEYKEYVEIGGEISETVAPALKERVNNVTKGTPLHSKGAMDDALRICTKKYPPNIDVEILLDCVSFY